MKKVVLSIIIFLITIYVIANNIIDYYGDIINTENLTLENTTIYIHNGSFTSFASMKGTNSRIVVDSAQGVPIPTTTTVITTSTTSTTTSTTTTVQINIHLSEGWNLMSFPINLTKSITE